MLYLQDISFLINSYSLTFHIFADDIQIYIPFSKNNRQLQLNKLKSCLKDIETWSKHNFLKLNQSKTQFLHICYKNSLRTIEHIDIFGETFSFLPKAKSLGFLIDEKLSFTSQVSKVVKAGYFFLNNLWQISSKLNSTTLKLQMVHACIISQIDYCNSLYLNIPKKETKRLQKLMNSAVRFVYSIRNPRTHMTPFLKKCHLLPVHLRINFKICVLVFKCLANLAPSYLQNLLSPKVSLSSLRIHHDKTLLTQPIPTCSFHNRQFSVAGPRLWNQLPQSLRESSTLSIFKSKLKTHLFNSF